MFNTDILTEKFKKKLDESREMLSESISRTIAENLRNGNNVIYALDHSGDLPWDSSGELYEAGKIDLESGITVKEYLSFYTGSRIPARESGCGFKYDTWEEFLKEIISESMTYIFIDILRKEAAETDKNTLYKYYTEKEPAAPSYEEFDKNNEQQMNDIYEVVLQEFGYDIICETLEDYFQSLPVIVNNKTLKEIIDGWGE